MTLSYRHPRPRLAPRVLALAGSAAAIAVAGCASATAPHGSPGASLAGTTSTASPASTLSGAAMPKQRAQADAARILESFKAPPGAHAVPASPVPSSSLSGGPSMGTPGDSDMVTLTAWWVAAGEPQKVLAWAAAHLPAAFKPDVSSGPAGGAWGDGFDLPVAGLAPGLIVPRTLDVSVTSAGHGQTAIRVDVFVGWIPARPSGDTVPATARFVTLSATGYKPGQTSGQPVTKKATVTDPARVRALAAYLDRLAVSPAVEYSCQAGTLGTLTLTFRARSGGPVLATATGTAEGCGTLSYTMPGRPAAGLGGTGATGRLRTEVNQVTGLHWTIPQSG
jgi:hypothetical protein